MNLDAASAAWLEAYMASGGEHTPELLAAREALDAARDAVADAMRAIPYGVKNLEASDVAGDLDDVDTREAYAEGVLDALNGEEPCADDDAYVLGYGDAERGEWPQGTTRADVLAYLEP
ncbi:hypothetical protein [Beutenbergia cavernae]|uniref:hypothetical protein n=1 Tax=Beutenbergia cavernae TaxID=84757 RepID=UPI00019AD160|nr:hypothetical protein [Beutenbergia cavernae]